MEHQIPSSLLQDKKRTKRLHSRLKGPIIMVMKRKMSDTSANARFQECISLHSDLLVKKIYTKSIVTDPIIKCLISNPMDNYPSFHFSLHC